MCITAILCVAFIGLLTTYLLILKSRYTYFVRRNIPGPPPQFFFGHLLQLWGAPLSFLQIHEWSRQYGSIYGLFEGTRPVYIVSDPDFLQEVYIKQFSSFHSRRTNFLSRTHQNKAAHLFSAHGDQWRRQRHVINPTFTAVKLRIMTPLMNKCIHSMMAKFEEMNGDEFDIYGFYKRLSMDVSYILSHLCTNPQISSLVSISLLALGHCVFGIDTDMQNDVENIYMKKSAACVAVEIEKLFIVKVSIIMPFLIPLLSRIVKTYFFIVQSLRVWVPSLMRNVEDLPDIWIMKQVKNVVKDRLTLGIQRMDLLQLMLDAVNDKEDQESGGLISKHLNFNEVLMNIFLFMVAGYESTASVLGYCTYILATEDDVQRKLQAEIDECWKTNEDDIDYNVIANMKYMDLFFQEVLRLYPSSGKVINRESNVDTVVCGHQIGKGTIIIPDVYSLHRNVDLWGPEDVNLFIPERHSIKRHPAAFMGFGIGPRNCVGMKFALMELKMSLAYLLHTYNILPGKQLNQCMILREGNVITPGAVYIQLRKREK